MGAALEGAGLPLPQYDGVVEFEAEALETILEIFRSEEYKEVVRKYVSYWAANSNS
jgi:hypothetical protein